MSDCGDSMNTPRLTRLGYRKSVVFYADYSAESDIDSEENTSIFGNMEPGYSKNTDSETGKSELPDGAVGGDKQASTAESKLQTDTEMDA